MAFHDVRLPEEIERGAQGGPEFKTTVFTLSSGYEKRNIDWERTRGSWDISYGLDRKANMEAVLAFFYARQGKAHSFRFKDWTDFEIGNASTGVPQSIGTGDGTKKKFQIVRKYASGGYTFSRYVTRPVAGTIRVFLDAVEQSSGYSVDTETGVVTFISAPAEDVVVGVICEFDVPVRFDIDKLDMQAFWAGDYTLPNITIIEVRETLEDLSA
jgi:uncharacterized protein (TIGR02217 family)